MNKRLRKQLIYGCIYTAMWLVPLVIFLISIQPEPTCFDDKRNQREEEVDCGGQCEPCDIKEAQSIQVIWENYFAIGPTQVAVGAKIRNPNLEIGVSKFEYEFQIIGQFGVVVRRLGGESYVFPGESKHLVEGIGDLSSKEVTAVKLIISNISWDRNNALDSPSQVSSQSIKAASSGDKKSIEITGRIINNETHSLDAVDVKALVFSKARIPMLVSKTRVEKLLPGIERSFRMVVPAQLINHEELDVQTIDIEIEEVRQVLIL